jgi:hypothetical protein
MKARQPMKNLWTVPGPGVPSVSIHTLRVVNRLFVPT